jgi:hypothetical protein
MDGAAGRGLTMDIKEDLWLGRRPVAIKYYYFVVEEATTAELAAKVSVYLNNGWYLWGEVMAVFHPGAHESRREVSTWRPPGMLYLQAVQKEIEVGDGD